MLAIISHYCEWESEPAIIVNEMYIHFIQVLCSHINHQMSSPKYLYVFISVALNLCALCRSLRGL